MKTYIKSILLGTGLFSLLSCSDFLDQSSPSELKGENVFNSVVYTEQALNKVYADLTYDHTYGSRIPINFGNNTDIELANATKQSEVHQNSERGLGNYYLSKGWDKLDTGLLDLTLLRRDSIRTGKDVLLLLRMPISLLMVFVIVTC